MFGVSVEIFFEEEPLVIDRIVPVIRIMDSRADDVVVINPSFEQFVVEIFVDFEKEVVVAAVDDDCQLTVF